MKNVESSSHDAISRISVIIRTYNESKYLDELLSAIEKQVLKNSSVEVVLVDSGSTDGTLDIAKRHGAKIVHINKSDFTFGRSLNVGCRAASGSYLVFISGHCVPVNSSWLECLVRPLIDGVAECTYGRQRGRDSSKFSEEQLFLKYFPAYSKITQEGFFCNNANAAVLKKSWEKFEYNEMLTGLEDMYLGRQLVEAGGKIAYICEAEVFHIHDESWTQVRVRYEREALALQQILPNVHFGFFDFIVYSIAAIFRDLSSSFKSRSLFLNAKDIVLFRLMQYWGTYKGSRRHRIVSDAVKHSYFYPKDVERAKYVIEENRGVAAHEGQ